jgi:phosphopentomutase
MVSKNTKSTTLLTLALAAAAFNTSFVGKVTDLKTTNGFLDAYLKTARHSIVGVNLVVMDQALHDTFHGFNFSQMV